MGIINYINHFLSSYDNQQMVLLLIDAVIFLLVAVSVLYLLIFAISSIRKPKNEYPKARKKYRYAILFPAYKEDNVIGNSVKSFQKQDFPRENYDIFVASDGMREETNMALREMGVNVIDITGQRSTKTNALRALIKYIEGQKQRYDYVVVLNADNTVSDNFMERLNDAFYSGCSAIQTHRIGKEYTTDVAYLDAVSEEINNSIFRTGHSRLGFSSGLLGSGMAFEYRLFSRFIMQAKNLGVDKQLEIFLVKNSYYIDFLQDVYTYDEKVSDNRQFYEQRKRWLAMQLWNLFNGLWGGLQAAIDGNWDYCNKLFQWAMPPRVILLGTITIIAVIYTIVMPTWAIKWWVLLFVLIMVFAIAIPDYLFNKRLVKAVVSIPVLFFLMFIDMFLALGRRRHRR